jgi:hypothetical protein
MFVAKREAEMCRLARQAEKAGADGLVQSATAKANQVSLALAGQFWQFLHDRTGMLSFSRMTGIAKTAERGIWRGRDP